RYRSCSTSPLTPESGSPSRPRTGGRGAKWARKSSYVASTRWSFTSGSAQGSRDQLDAGAAHLVEGPLPVAVRQVHRPDRVQEDCRLEAELDRVEGGRLHAVVGGQPAH